MQANRRTVGVFDAGIGGVPLTARIARAGHQIVYLGDAGRRPYGPRPQSEVATYVTEAEQFFADAGCDVWAIACNTASVVAAESTRGLLPRVDMVAAVLADFPPGGNGAIGVLATAGTVSSNVFPRSLTGYTVHQVATEELLRLAEEGGGDSKTVRALADEAFDELREAGCDTAVLACTDFTCVLDDLAAVAGQIRLVDPLDAAVRLVEDALSDLPPRTEHAGNADRLVLTGAHPVDIPRYARQRFGLSLPEPEYIDVGGGTGAAAAAQPKA